MRSKTVGQAQQLYSQPVMIFFFERFKPVMMGSHFVNELSHIIMNTIFFLFLLSFEHVFIFFIEIKEDLKDGFRSQV
jgi:hypothetical protein